MSAEEPSFPVTGILLFPVYLCRTEFAIFRPVGAGKERLSADRAAFHIFPEQQRCFQRLVQREDSGAKPFAQQGVGNTLHTDTFLSIVQRNAAAVVIVAAFMYQLSCPAVLLVAHNKYFILYIHHLLTVRKYPFTIPFIFRVNFRGLFEKFTKNLQIILSERAAAKSFHNFVHIQGESCSLT